MIDWLPETTEFVMLSGPAAEIAALKPCGSPIGSFAMATLFVTNVFSIVTGKLYSLSLMPAESAPIEWGLTRGRTPADCW